MPTYTVVSEEGGLTRLVHVANEAEAQAQLQPGELAVPGEAPADTYWHNNQWAARPPRPSVHHAWTRSGWVISMARAQAKKRAEINAVRDEMELSPVTWDGDVFDADRDSVLRIIGAISMSAAGLLTSLDWTLANNTVRTMSGPDIVALMTTIGQRSSVLHATARTLKAQVDAATTPEELAAIAWPTGV